jgi:hypothetical protein
MIKSYFSFKAKSHSYVWFSMNGEKHLPRIPTLQLSPVEILNVISGNLYFRFYSSFDELTIHNFHGGWLKDEESQFPTLALK